MKKLKIVLVAFCLGLVLINLNSCNQESPLKKEVITETNLSEIANKAVSDNLMAKEDIELLIAGIERLGTHKDSLIGKTIGQVIDNQKNILKQSAMDRLKIASARQEMFFAMAVKFIQKIKIEQDTVNADGIDFEVTNNSKKEIIAIQGFIKIVNELNQPVILRPINYPKVTLKPGESAKQREAWLFDPNNTQFRDGKNLTAMWIPQTITFADNTKMTTDLVNTSNDKNDNQKHEEKKVNEEKK